MLINRPSNVQRPLLLKFGMWTENGRERHWPEGWRGYPRQAADVLCNPDQLIENSQNSAYLHHLRCGLLQSLPLQTEHVSFCPASGCQRALFQSGKPTAYWIALTALSGWSPALYAPKFRAAVLVPILSPSHKREFIWGKHVTINYVF